MHHNHFTEGLKATGSGSANTNMTPSTSAYQPNNKLVRPEDRIRQIKRRMKQPSLNRKAIKIDSPSSDPTVRKKTRYEHSLTRIVKNNPQVTSTIQKIQKSASNNSIYTPVLPPKDEQLNRIITPEHVNDEKLEITSNHDSTSIISTTPSIEISSDTDLDKQLIEELTVSDSDDEMDSETEQKSSKSDISVNNIIETNKEEDNPTDIDLQKTNHTATTPYDVEITQPIPTYTPTPKKNIQERGKRAVKYIPVSEWMFDQWRIICKANQVVGEAMKVAMIKEGLLYARK